MVLEQAISWKAMSGASDELLLAALSCEAYALRGLDDQGRILFRSRSPNFVFYIDTLCLGTQPGEFTVVSYSLVDFTYGTLQ